MCEAYLGIAPHFNLFLALFKLRPQPKKGATKVVGGCGLVLRQGMNAKYLEVALKDTNKGWKSEWFVIENPSPSLPAKSGFPPIHRAEWDNQPSTGEMDQVSELLKDLAALKEKGLTYP